MLEWIKDNIRNILGTSVLRSELFCTNENLILWRGKWQTALLASPRRGMALYFKYPPPTLLRHNRLTTLCNLKVYSLLTWYIIFWNSSQMEKKKKRKDRETTPMLFSERTGNLKEEVCDSLFFNEPTLSSEWNPSGSYKHENWKTAVFRQHKRLLDI